jgi:mono/diheme cytochrome c family protein
MKRLVVTAAIAAIAIPALAATIDTSPRQLIATYAQQAGAKADPAAGKALFLGNHTGGKPDTPSCSTCHTNDPRAMGKLRTGKVVQPLAPSANPARFTNTHNVEKWFGRNCNNVLGRDCTATEKANIIAWLASL